MLYPVGYPKGYDLDGVKHYMHVPHPMFTDLGDLPLKGPSAPAPTSGPLLNSSLTSVKLFVAAGSSPSGQPVPKAHWEAHLDVQTFPTVANGRLTSGPLALALQSGLKQALTALHAAPAYQRPLPPAADPMAEDMVAPSDQALDFLSADFA